jgi:hypothetical protein
VTDLIERARAAAQHSREYGPGTNAPLLDELAAALEAAREDGWQPIETAPRDGTRILAMIRWSWSDGTDGEAQDVIYWHARAQFWVCGTPMNYVQVLDEGVAPTHWRPLPAPPAIDQACRKGGCGEGGGRDRVSVQVR